VRPPHELFVDPKTGAKALLYSLLRNRGITWEAAKKMLQNVLARFTEDEEDMEMDLALHHILAQEEAGGSRAQAQACPAQHASKPVPVAVAKKEEGAEADKKVGGGAMHVDEAGVVRVPLPLASAPWPYPGQ